MLVSGYSLNTCTSLSRFCFAVDVRLDLLVSNRTEFSPSVSFIPSPTLSTSAPGNVCSIFWACLSILLPITPPTVPPTTPPIIAPSAVLPPLPILLPNIPPITAPEAAPIPAPRCVLLVFLIASHELIPILSTNARASK